jgi:hypothetical protein
VSFLHYFNLRQAECTLEKEKTMTVNLRAERLFEQIELVRGAGSRKRGQLCIMTLVAYLAGDRHIDRPLTASPFVRNFAIKLNDGAPTALRQDLKVFAPRIIGTNDGHDFERAALVYRVVASEVWPRARCDALVGWGNPRYKLGIKGFVNFLAAPFGNGPIPTISSQFQAVCDAYDRGEYLAVAASAGELLAALVQIVPTQGWYWAKALDLLDRLCDIGEDQRASERVEAAARVPANPSS